ncbi:MAG: hypothetical protein AAGD23_07430 [Pseudomonadota bacterium]
MKKFAFLGTAMAALTLAACTSDHHCHFHHCEPVMVKGFTSTAEAPAMPTAPAADWK